LPNPFPFYPEEVPYPKEVIMNWVKCGTDVAVGGGAGALGEYVSEKDDPAKDWYKQPSIYYKYGFPIAAILLAAFGVIRGDWETRLITAGSTLAGGKAYGQIKAASAPAGYHRWTKKAELQRQREEARRRAASRGGGGGEAGSVIAEI